MAWIESHDDIWDHWKTEKLCDLLEHHFDGLEREEVRSLLVGKLLRLWHFVLRNAWRDASLEKWGDGGIERASRWERQPGAFVAALREAGWLDGFIAHGWSERAGRLVQDRFRNESRRSTAVLPPYIGSKPLATVPNRTVPNLTVPKTLAESHLDSPQVLGFPVNGKNKKEWALTEAKVAEYTESFPGVDVLAECRIARQWCIDNPQKRKTTTGMPAFLTRWLSKKQNSGAKLTTHDAEGERGRKAFDDYRKDTSAF